MILSKWVTAGFFLVCIFASAAFVFSDMQWSAANADQRVLWKKQLGGEIEQAPVIDEFGAVYIAAENGDIAAYEKDGQEKWKTHISTEIIRSSPVLVEEQIIIGGEDGMLRALDRSTGKVMWVRPLGSSVRTTVAYDALREIIYAGTQGGEIIALTTSGNVLWRVRVEGPVSSSPAVDSDGTIYAGSHAGEVLAIKDGRILWTHNVGAMILASPALTRTSLVIGAEDGNVLAFKKDGSKLWTWRAPNERTANRGIESSPAVGSDGTIYVGSKNHRLYALRDGKLRWAVELGWEIESSPTIGRDGTIYVGAEDHNIYAISPLGKIIWLIHTGGQVDSPPAIDGSQLYVGSQDGFLYGVKIGNSGLMVSPWPKFHANTKNDGRVEE